MRQPDGDLTVRAYRGEDVPRLAEIFREAVAAIGPANYSETQVAAWLGRVPSADALAERLGDGRRVWVLADQAGCAFAFIDLEPDGHIDLLYASPAIAGRGAVAVLFAELEGHALTVGMARLHVEASAAARRFFLKQGFAVVQRRTFEIDGVEIHNFAMEKVL
ncbi:GNAT family N-acetyltransferase [Hyphomonas oceanitis]|uniref:Acetyltransferase n=1 Tax=Hyphomonas oceanitis SCH89 TaxID=1280953 RepID=A0A059G418_9PROT|nr:GNAT family N-acetyltransferase [Hyphomonas oceanitis]KDA01459.1 acetyltransferase [Hyphomonas oceanitis SCH89]